MIKSILRVTESKVMVTALLKGEVNGKLKVEERVPRLFLSTCFPCAKPRKEQAQECMSLWESTLRLSGKAL